MREIKASEFKAKCLRLLDEVAETGEGIVVTKNGKPVARIESVREMKNTLRGSLKGVIEIVDPNDDLVSTWDDDQEQAHEKSQQRLASDVASLGPRRKRG